MLGRFPEFDFELRFVAGTVAKWQRIAGNGEQFRQSTPYRLKLLLNLGPPRPYQVGRPFDLALGVGN